MTHVEKALIFLVLANVMLTINEGWSDLLLSIACLAVSVGHLYRSAFPAKDAAR